MSTLTYVCQHLAILVVTTVALEFGVCRQATNDLIFYDVTPKACLDECQTRPGCFSVSMHVLSHMCYLNVLQPGPKQSCPGYIYEERSPAVLALSPECVDAGCTSDQVCVTIGKGTMCENRECLANATIPNGVVIGNQRQVGARILIECDVTYVAVPTSLECSSWGEWVNPYDGLLGVVQCLKECPDPPVVSNTAIVGSNRYEGSRITYVCWDYFLRAGPDNYTCHADGTWLPDENGNNNTTCTQNYCTQPPPIENGTYVVGSNSVTYSCNEGLVLIGPTSFQCLVSFLWRASGTCSLANTGDDLLTSPPRCVVETCDVKPLSFYQVHAEEMTWESASVLCSNTGGHLVAFSCEAEYQLVVEMMQNASILQIYVGVNDIDLGCDWVWTGSQEHFTFRPWAPGEPNNYLSYGEHCGVLSDHKSYLMDDRYCLEMHAFICEF